MLLPLQCVLVVSVHIAPCSARCEPCEYLTALASSVAAQDTLVQTHKPRAPPSLALTMVSRDAVVSCMQ